jgi:microcystin-dependent protein
MACSNCFNGCTEIISDQCVRYTGIDVPVLGIQTGDSLSYVEQALITFLTSTLNGTGIKIDIPTSTTICTLVKKYLPTCGDLTAVDLFNALIKAVCDLQVQVTAIASAVSTIEAAYNISCLTGVTSTSGTHAILQATINNLCALNSSLTALSIDVDTNYVKNSELCDLVTACIENNNPGGGTQHYLKMVPYTVVEYYGDIVGNFGTSGEGLGDWEKIYLCNGLNGTPDKRGRVGVGAIVGVPGGTLAAAVNPVSSAFNPNYALWDTAYGSNSVALTTSQIPSHSHTASASSVVTDPTHTHSFEATNNNDGGPRPNGFVNSNTGAVSTYTTGAASTGITVATSVTIAPAGGNLAHANNQPALACY